MRSVAPGLALRRDVLVIGGGMAGAWAAAEAARQGASVVLAEKGYCGTSGVTATAGPGHWWVPPEGRRAAIAARNEAALGLADPQWMERVLEETWRSLPGLARHYDFPRDEKGQVQYRALRGPEYMRALRAQAEELGVLILDHCPALELLAEENGRVGGARGLCRQDADAPWQVEAGATVLATGGTAFLSGLLGARNNTGDGYLMGAEAGAQLSGLEFTGIYTVAPARSTMTRSMSYAFATYYDADGHEIVVPPGPDNTATLARALLAGPVTCSLHRMPEAVRARLHLVSPNVMLPFVRWGIDPFRDRFPVTLHTDGTIRGTGGLRIVDAECGTGIPGLFAAGDAASRELIAGAISGGGAQNSAWALSSGLWAGRGAARFARGWRPGARLRGLGQAGLRPLRAVRPVEIEAARATVLGEMQPYDKNFFRTQAGLRRSRAVLDTAWGELRDHALPGHGGRERLRAREAAALLATARWSVTAALARAESRGLHRLEDIPRIVPDFAHRLLVDGIDTIRVTPDHVPALPETAA